MKALVMEDYRNFVYREVPTPKPGPGEVLVRVRACAVCGSDVHGSDGSSGRRIPPVIMGHEASGDIAECGEGVVSSKPGDRVTFDSTVYCNRCDMCAQGKVNLCRNRRVLGVSCKEYRMDGAFAEYVAVPEYLLYPLPDSVSYVQAAMVEPLAIAYHAAARTPVRQGTSVLVTGVGTIGMLTLQVALSMGASPAIAADIDEAKLADAKKLGAAVCVHSGDPGSLDAVLAATPEKRGVDVAFDATGIAATVNLCLQAVRLDGHAVLIGNIAQKIDFPLQWVVTRQLSLFGSCASAGEYPACLQLIADGKVDVEALVSKRVPLSDGNEWINRVYEREPGLNKIVLVP